MAIKKRIDWEGWLSGWWVDAIKAITSAFLTLVTTNGLDQLGIHGIAIGWKSALAFCGVQFLVASAKYFNANPKPDVVVETVETTFESKAPDGTAVSQGSKITTTTPVDPAQTNKQP